MYALIGQREEVTQREVGGPFESEFEEEVVALFDERGDAEDYIERSRLAQPRHNTYSGDDVFRQRSLLADCQDAWVEEYTEPSYPINPTL